MAIYFIVTALLSVLAFLCISDFVYALMQPTLKKRTSAPRVEEMSTSPTKTTPDLSTLLTEVPPRSEQQFIQAA